MRNRWGGGEGRDWDVRARAHSVSAHYFPCLPSAKDALPSFLASPCILFPLLPLAGFPGGARHQHKALRPRPPGQSALPPGQVHSRERGCPHEGRCKGGAPALAPASPPALTPPRLDEMRKECPGGFRIGSASHPATSKPHVGATSRQPFATPSSLLIALAAAASSLLAGVRSLFRSEGRREARRRPARRDPQGHRGIRNQPPWEEGHGATPGQSGGPKSERSGNQDAQAADRSS